MPEQGRTTRVDLAPLITALTAAVVALGGGAWKLIQRSDARRERREAAVEELLKERIQALQTQLEEEKAAHAKAMGEEKAAHAKERRAHSRMKATAGKWREQLIANDIQPDPADWPEVEL